MQHIVQHIFKNRLFDAFSVDSVYVTVRREYADASAASRGRRWCVFGLIGKAAAMQVRAAFRQRNIRSIRASAHRHRHLCRSDVQRKNCERQEQTAFHIHNARDVMQYLSGTYRVING